MQVIVLGAGTSIPAKGYSPAGLYVRVGREHLLIDLGPGTLQRLHMAGGYWQDVDRVFLTHFHVDHCLDLVTFLFAYRIPEPERRKPLTVYGPRGLARFYKQLNRVFHRWLEPKTYRLSLIELDETTIRIPSGLVRTKRMNHSTVALGYRVESRGKSLVYSGDTDTCESIVRLAQDTNVLILECSMPDSRKVPGHLTPTECGQIAARAHCRKLVLTHFYPVFAPGQIQRCVRRSYRGPLLLTRDFASFRV